MRSFLASVSAVMAAVLSALAQPPLTLAQARQIAFEKNWDLLAAKSGIDSAIAQLIAAKEFPNPSASLSTAYIGASRNATVVGNGLWERSYDTIFAVSQLIEIAGKRHDRQMAGRAGVIGAKARFYDAKRTLDQGVTKAYIAAPLAENNTRILNESSRLLRHEADIAQARFKAGDISDSDKKQIEINAEQFALRARTAETAMTQARIAVEVLMGEANPAGSYVSQESIESLAQLPAAGAESGGTRPDILAAEADARGARANLQLQKALRIPDPTFQIEYQHQPPGGGPPVDTFGFGVSFPLPLWNLNGGNIKAAQANVDQLEFAAGKARSQRAADLAAAQSEYNEARARWLNYRDQTAPKSARVREAVAFAYEKGGASLVDLLDAERTDNDVRLAAIQAMSDTAGAVADMAAARNVVTEAALQKRPY
ncbi:MAG TPA: TolC family protein [Verrucomicrobiae bacterium]|jgi:cobalt-zinc-cadmium efflux system outer membrane protein